MSPTSLLTTSLGICSSARQTHTACLTPQPVCRSFTHPHTAPSTTQCETCVLSLPLPPPTLPSLPLQLPDTFLAHTRTCYLFSTPGHKRRTAGFPPCTVPSMPGSVWHSVRGTSGHGFLACPSCTIWPARGAASQHFGGQRLCVCPGSQPQTEQAGQLQAARGSGHQGQLPGQGHV